jgi:D-inositol-3-phosphate glycosyltransferase
MLSLHTSPLAQPGSGDAGGMNVYVWEVSRRLAAAGVQVEIFTRATDSGQPPTEQVADGLLVRHIEAGPFQGLRKEDLPGQLCALSAGVLRAEAARPPGWFDLVHSHYWLSGQVGWVAKERWDVPLVHAMHTMAKVKNRDLGAGDAPEPQSRVIGEQQVVDIADMLIANTEAEADDLHRLYGAPDDAVTVVHPGVDLDVYTPGDAAAARLRLGLPPDRPVVVFVGRVQPLKAPDVLLRAVAAMPPSEGPEPVVVICGGPSGNGDAMPDELRELAVAGGIADRTEFLPPLPQPELVALFQAADVVAVPSYSESFGLVAVEAQACGTPVIAAAVGGLPTAVADGASGVLVASHDPDVWAGELHRLLHEPRRLAHLAAGARRHAERFSWQATTAETLRAYRAAADRHLAALDAARGA